MWSKSESGLEVLTRWVGTGSTAIASQCQVPGAKWVIPWCPFTRGKNTITKEL